MLEAEQGRADQWSCVRLQAILWYWTLSNCILMVVLPVLRHPPVRHWLQITDMRKIDKKKLPLRRASWKEKSKLSQSRRTDRCTAKSGPEH